MKRKTEKTIEKYTDDKESTWIRIKYEDEARTEVIMPKEVFENVYGKLDLKN